MPEPLSSFYSTAIHSKIDSIEKLACRNMKLLGAPLVNIELAQDMCYEAISIAVEWYTKYSEPSEEFLIFDSEIYTPGVGVKMDNLFSYTPELSSQTDLTNPNTVVGRDYDLNDWRRVIDVKNIEVGENQGTNLLFTLQYAMVQQMGALMHSGGLRKGFDLITWYNMNEFLELRNKLLALNIYTRFDKNTQILRLFPEPTGSASYGSVDRKFGRYYGLISAYVEPRFRDCLKNHWVQQYSLALMKIMVANVRGKFNGTQLLGGGSVNWDILMSQGIAEKEKLEEQAMTGTGGMIDGAPPVFLVY